MKKLTKLVSIVLRSRADISINQLEVAMDALRSVSKFLSRPRHGCDSDGNIDHNMKADFRFCDLEHAFDTAANTIQSVQNKLNTTLKNFK